MNAITQPTAPSPRHWAARLDLRFAHRHGRTRLAHAEHQGPLRIQRLFHPETDGTAHCYLLHPPGGVAAGDELSIDVAVDSGSALLTTPSAGRFYRVGALPQPQLQRVTLRGESGSRLAWLPQETLIYPGANAILDTRIELQGDAALSFWDIAVLGRPAAGEGFETGACKQRIQLRMDGRLVLEELLQLEAGDRLSRSAAGLNALSTSGVFISRLEADPELCRRWLARVNPDPAQGNFAVTQRGPLLIARYLGDDAALARQGFAALWVELAQASACPVSIPRIWHT